MKTLTFSTPLSEFQMKMLEEAEVRENRRFIEDFEEGQLYELTEKAKATQKIKENSL